MKEEKFQLLSKNSHHFRLVFGIGLQQLGGENIFAMDTECACEDKLYSAFLSGDDGICIITAQP